MSFYLNKKIAQDFVKAKPVLKWAGGKGQLLPVIRENLPLSFGSNVRKYAEPFIGGGAVFFDLYNSGLIDEAILSDNNPELVLLYNTIKGNPDALLQELEILEKKYLPKSDEDRKEIFYQIREDFNASKKEEYTNIDVRRAAHIIFLNRTCFNGLYRVNSKGHFNVPQGNYKNPKILDTENIYQTSEAFQIAEIVNQDFQAVCENLNSEYFIYFDPPYRPLSKTSNFNAYSDEFNDNEQIRLAETYKQNHKKGILQMLSNSDPLSANGDDFFEKLYKGFNIDRVEASRMINSVSSKRGKIFELLITNYE